MHTSQSAYAMSTTLAYGDRGCPNPVIRAVAAKPPGRVLKCHAKSEDFGRKLRDRFTLTDKLYEDAQRPSSELSHLLNLPCEILGLIHQNLGNVSNQIAFALACKHLALIARGLNLNLSSTSPKYAGFLPNKVFDVPNLMQSLVCWMPSTLRLCDHCLTMRPYDRDYWVDVDGCHGSNFWVTKTGWTFADASWHKQVHNICPACHVNCSLSDYVDCDGCRALGRLGDVDWSRVSGDRRNLLSEAMRASL